MNTTKIWYLGWAIFLSVVVVGTAAEPLPDLDLRGEQGKFPRGPVTIQAGAVETLKGQIPQLSVEFDPFTGSPKSIASWQTFLTGSSGGSKSVTTRFTTVPADPDAPAKAFLDAHRDLFGYGSEALASARVNRAYVTAHNGLRTVVWQQQAAGIPVVDAVLLANTTKHGELVNVSSQFLPDLAGATMGKSPIPAITAQAALRAAAKNVGEVVAEADVESVDSPAPDAELKQHLKSTKLSGEITASLAWLPLGRQDAALCWEVIFSSHGEMFRVFVDATSGKVLLRRNLTRYISPAFYNVFTSDSPSPFSPGHAAPSSVQPPLTNRTLVSISALDTNASPNGWINDGVTETVGNNVDAHTDIDDNDVADLPRPSSGERYFDFPLDLTTQDPTNYSSAAVVQLFYTCNWMHDRLYQLGFTEAAGNFQSDNFSRGGAGNDPVQGDAQDGSGLDNANFATPGDGGAPRMQMYIFSEPSPRRDGDFDAEIMLHEYTHGLSQRLVGGGVGMNALQSDGMGEGWSDFYGLSLLSNPTDDTNGVYAAAGYASYLIGGPSDQQNYYFGIRRYPYSTDLNKNPLTFNDLDPAQADNCASPAPYHTGMFGSCTPSIANEVHNQGELWCVTLWDARANIIGKHGWAVGNELILKLVTDGMKLAPVNPNFLQARDAILQADLVYTGGANTNELWAAFAKRGMGNGATSPSSASTTGVLESFNIPDSLQISPFTGYIFNGPVGGPFGVSNRTYTVSNAGGAPINWHAMNPTAWLNVSPGSGSLAPGGGGTSVQVSLTAAASLLPQGIYPASIQFVNESNSVAQAISFTLRVGQPDSFTQVFTGGGASLNSLSWLFTPDGSVSFYSVCSTPAAAFPTDPTGGTTVTLADDSSVAVTLSSTNTVAIYSRRTNVFYIGSNGYLTLNGGDSTNDETPAAHFAFSRVAALLDDLDPSAGGTITRKELSDRVVVTFQNVPEYNIANVNNIQIELFFDGRIRFTRLNCAALSGVIGLSAGLGVPANFLTSDFTSYPTCPVPLSLSLPSSVTEGAGTVGASVQISQAVGTNVTVTLVSGNTNEITVPATATILAGQTSGNFNVTVVNDVLLDGTQSASVQASASGFASAQGNILVNDNESATLHISLPATVSESAGNVSGTLWVSGVPGRPVNVALSSSDAAKVAIPSTLTLPAGQTSVVFSASVIDPYISGGSQAIDVTGHVQNWTDAIATMTVLFDDTTNLSTFANSAFITINDNAAASPYPSSIVVSNVTGNIAKVTASLAGVTHTFPADLDILLVGPTGTNVMLMSDAGGGGDIGGYNFTFDDNSPNIMTAAGPLLPGTYVPTNYSTGDVMPAPAPASPFGIKLAAFAGQNPNGTWKLYVFDDQSIDSGNIASGWNLQITTVIPSPKFLPPFLNAGQVQLRFNTVTGVNYTLEYKAAVDDPSWQTLLATNGTGSIVTKLNNPTNQARFFRIRVP